MSVNHIIFSKALCDDPTAKYAIYDANTWPGRNAILLETGEIKDTILHIDYDPLLITVVAIGLSATWSQGEYTTTGDLMLNSGYDFY